MASLSHKSQSQSPFPRPMAHRAAPVSISIALGHESANTVKAAAGGWSTGSSASLTFPLHSHMSSARREGSEYHFKSLWYDSAGARTHDQLVVMQTLYHGAINTVHFTTSKYILNILKQSTCTKTLVSRPLLF